MTSSPKPASRKVIDDLPPALSSMWRLCKLGYRHEPGMLLASFLMSLFAAVPDTLTAVWLVVLGNGVLQHNRTRVLAAAIAIGLSATGTWFLRIATMRVQRRFRDKVTIALESHVARLQASTATIEHHERPEYLDRLAMLRNQVFVLDHMYLSLFSTCAWILRLAIVIVLLVSIHPGLILLAVFGVPVFWTSAWRPAVERKAWESRAWAHRLARHLFVTATTAASGKEVRVTGIGERLIVDRRSAWEWWYAGVSRARWDTARWHALAWAVFGSAYIGAVVFVAAVLHASAGNVLLVLAAGARLSAYIGGTVGEIGFLRGIWMDGSKRLAWLENYVASLSAAADLPVPTRLAKGIRLANVSFAYPGIDRLVLNDVSLDLPAGSVVAIVGENGAGKTTLVKLLGKFYEPTTGTIYVDDQPLARIPAEGWRQRIAGAFQDFFRFELRARQSIGVGDLPHLDDTVAVTTAVDRAGAADVVARLPVGLDTQLGPTWPQGVEVSFGQWQKVALARGFMREQPLLIVLDEPTAALDAETEHALFERYAEAAHGNKSAGRITILVSHRFSTVRMADLIIVLDGSRVAEVGTHQELMARRGPYSELYGIQAAAYQ